MRKFVLLCVFLCTLFVSNSTFAQSPTAVFDRKTSGSGFYQVSCNATSVKIEIWGAGGGGGGSIYDLAGWANSSAGGGGGAYSIKTINNPAANTQINYTIGAGGSGGSYNNGADGGVSFYNINGGSNYNVNGGKGGQGGQENDTNGGAGGAASTNGFDVSFKGGNGGNGVSGNAGGGGGSAAPGTSGNGIAGNNGGTPNGGAAQTGGSAGGAGYGGSGSGAGTNAPDFGGGGGGAQSRYLSNNYNGGNGGSGRIRISITISNSLCIPLITNSEPITNVNFAGINKTTSELTTSPKYEAFCTPVANVSQGVTYPIALKGNTNGNWTNYFTVFIDWNQNGNFDDADEKYEIGTIVNSTGIDSKVLNGSIAVPATALVGETNMRVIKRFGASPTIACTNFTYGQVEDYKVNVIFNPMPVSFVQIAASKNADNRTNKVQWTIANESNINHYELQRSNNGLDFSPIISNIPSTGNTEYTVIDENPLSGINYYRAKAYDLNGSVFYSNIATVSQELEKGSITVYPNPILGSEVKVKFNEMPAGKYKLQMSNQLGQVISSSEISVIGNQEIDFKMNKEVSKGFYYLIITDSKGQPIKTEKLIKN